MLKHYGLTGYERVTLQRRVDSKLADLLRVHESEKQLRIHR